MASYYISLETVTKGLEPLYFEIIENLQHTFQCFRVGKAVTFPRPSVLFSFSNIESKSELLLSPVERRLSARPFSKGSKLLCLLAGGVKGDDFTVLFGGSVGLKTAGTYRGDFGGLSCLVCAGRKDSVEFRGDVGEELLGVAVAELMGEVC